MQPTLASCGSFLNSSYDGWTGSWRPLWGVGAGKAVPTAEHFNAAYRDRDAPQWDDGQDAAPELAWTRPSPAVGDPASPPRRPPVIAAVSAPDCANKGWSHPRGRPRSVL